MYNIAQKCLKRDIIIKKDTVIFMELRQKPANRRQDKVRKDLPPTTSMMFRVTTGERDVFGGRGMSEGLETKDNKGAQDGKTPLVLWQSNRTDEIVC
jgi:hypothetical protein